MAAMIKDRLAENANRPFRHLGEIKTELVSGWDNGLADGWSGESNDPLIR